MKVGKQISKWIRFFYRDNFQSKEEKNECNSYQNSAKPDEIAKYINKIFEQQEKERIIRWMVDSIRESLDLDKVLETIVAEVGKLLKVDRCLVALYNKEKSKFLLKNEYKLNEQITSVLADDNFAVTTFPRRWLDLIKTGSLPVVINNIEEDSLNEEEKDYLVLNNLKSLILVPVIHKSELLGVLIVHQIDNKRKWETAHVEILRDTGGQIAVAIMQAILYRQVKESTNLKSEFLASMSHELRTPLNSIIGFSDMLLTDNYGPLSEKQKKFLQNISVSGKHLLLLVNDVLDLSKVESGNLEFHYEIFKVNLVIQESVAVLNSVAIKKNISIETNLNEEILINADVGKFKQIMCNLISNAIKFTEPNGKIYINTFYFQNQLKVEVCDTGIGISSKNRDKVFTKFSQIDSSYARKQEGSGLGLTLTKKLIEMQKGSIDFESEKDKGSKFWFILPEAKLTTNNNVLG